MNYELAVKLKDAGFPQKDVTTPILFREPDSNGNVESARAIDGVYAPTLEDLIEACGDRFGKLLSPTYRERYDGRRDHWTALSDDDRTDMYDVEGKTPEEAVANLWLTINRR